MVEATRGLSRLELFLSIDMEFFSMKSMTFLALVGGLCGLMTAPAVAQTWPSRNVSIVVDGRD